MINLDTIEQKDLHEKSIEKMLDKYNDNIIYDMAYLLNILGEPSRLKIVLALEHSEMCVFHLTNAVKSNQSAVSHQLRILRENRIIKSRRVGKNILYSLMDEHIMEIVNLVKVHIEE